MTYILTLGLITILIDHVFCAQVCYYYITNTNILKSINCPSRCCYYGNNYFTSSQQTCCPYSSSYGATWWIVFPCIIFVIFVTVTILKLCCFKGRPMIFGRGRFGKPVTFIPTRSQQVIIHTNGASLNNNAYPNGSGMNSYPTQNLGYTGPNYNQAYLSDPNFKSTDQELPPKYEDLSILPPQTSDNKPPIGFKMQ